MAFTGITPQQAGLNPASLTNQGLKLGADGMVYTNGGELWQPTTSQGQPLMPQGPAAPTPVPPPQSNVNAFLQNANAPIIPFSPQQLGATPQMQTPQTSAPPPNMPQQQPQQFNQSMMNMPWLRQAMNVGQNFQTQQSAMPMGQMQGSPIPQGGMPQGSMNMNSTGGLPNLPPVLSGVPTNQSQTQPGFNGARPLGTLLR